MFFFFKMAPISIQVRPGGVPPPCEVSNQSAEASVT